MKPDELTPLPVAYPSGALPGNNTITLCQAAVQEAVQEAMQEAIRYWLEHVHLKTPPNITALQIEAGHSFVWRITATITDEVPK